MSTWYSNQKNRLSKLNLHTTLLCISATLASVPHSRYMQLVNDTMVSECDFAKVVDLCRNVISTFNSRNRVFQFEYSCLDSVCACITDFSLRMGSHKTQNNKVFYEFKIIDFSCMLAHRENTNIATVAQSKPHIIAKCNVFGVLVPKYATIPLFLMGYCPLERCKKFGSKRKNCVFGWQIIKKYAFPASERSKTFKNVFNARFYFQKTVWGQS